MARATQARMETGRNVLQRMIGLGRNGSLNLLMVTLAIVVVLTCIAVASAEASTVEGGDGIDDCPRSLICETVEVPLDRGDASTPTLELPVRATAQPGPLLIVLAGGPGQSAIALSRLLIRELRRIAPGWRLALFDQRGTGATAIDCPGLQQHKRTDFTVPRADDVRECARILGENRANYSTTDSAHDIDAVRKALGASRTAVFGISYGTFVAERYARLYPDRITRLVLDSAIPQEGLMPFFAANLRTARVVLADSCVSRTCARESVDALAELVRRPAVRGRHPRTGEPIVVDRHALFETLATLAAFRQRWITFFRRSVVFALQGRTSPLLRVVEATRDLSPSSPPELMSWGLHAATICTDTRFPWGRSDAPSGERRAALMRAASRLSPAGVWPFDRRTAAGNGIIRACLGWPATEVEPPPAPAPLPRVPILILAGEHDMLTPPRSALVEARRSPWSKLVTVPRGGHFLALGGGCATLAMARFMANRLNATDCAKLIAQARSS